MNSNINRRIWTFLCLTMSCFVGFAQETVTITGSISDAQGSPISGASIVVDGTSIGTISDLDGKYSINVPKGGNVSVSFIGYKQANAVIDNGDVKHDFVLLLDNDVKDMFANRLVRTASVHNHSALESVASTSIIESKDIASRYAKNIGNALFGQGLGLTTLAGRGHYADYNPTFYVRGIKTLSDYSSAPMILVDGIERSIDDVTPYEVESVTILKDAAALALYGYKGVNGAINITTKRGEYETKHVEVSYSRSFDRQFRKPEFVDAYNYALAVNEANRNDGATADVYTPEAINAYKTGVNPELFPNVDWQKETLKDWSHTSNYNITFFGGSKKFKYYTMLNLNDNRGFNKCGEDNADYRTQDQYSRGSLRSNIDVDITETTKMKLNILGTLSEARKLGTNFSSSTNGYSYTSVWDALYRVPANAFPVRLANGYWGGVTNNTGLDGTYNPVALTSDAGYIKNHNRSIFLDLSLDQDLSYFVEGLGANFKLAYDNSANYVENYTRTYDYASYYVNGGKAVTFDEKGNITKAPTAPLVSADSDGNSISSSLGTNAFVPTFSRNVSIYGALYYDNQISDNQKIYAQLQYDFERRDVQGVNATNYYQNFSAYAHYVLNGKYLADVNFVVARKNLFAPGHRTAFSPSVALGWIVSNEDFLESSDVCKLLKVRASWGRIPSANIPGNGYWVQTFDGQSGYLFDGAYASPSGTTMPGRLATPDDCEHEAADKFNVGIDANLFGKLNINVEAFMENRHNIWVDATNKYSEVLGFTAPFETEGRVVSKGIEAALDFTTMLGNVKFNVGGKFTFNRNEIKEQFEETRPCDNLVRTGHAVNQIFGYKTVGFFQSQEDIDSYNQSLGTTLKPGDLKYEDVNKDGKVDNNDMTAIGYNTYCPEIYYSFNLGAEWKGWGVSALFQGAANYSAYLNTTSVYVPLQNFYNISKEYYDNCWKVGQDNSNALYPRLTRESNANNFVQNTTWVQNRSFLKLRNVELFYNFSDDLLKKTRVLNGAKVFVRGTDLACFDHLKVVDPECYGVGYPLTQSIVAGLSILF